MLSVFKKCISIVIIFLIGISCNLFALESNDTVELVLSGVPRKDARSLNEKISREIFETFLKKFPYIKVKLLQGIRLENQHSFDAIIMSFAAGTAPDVFGIPFRNVSTFIENGFFYPLDEYFEKWSKEEDLNKKIIPQAWKVIRQKGHIWGVPSGFSVNALIYRKDLFKKAGLDPNRGPRDWDELYEYALKLTDQEAGRYGFGLFGQIGGLAWFWQNFLWQAGGEVLEQDKDGNWKAVFNSPAGVEALKFYQKLVRGKFVKNGKEYRGVAKIVLWTLWDEFDEGKIAMVFSLYRPGEITIVPPELDPNIVGISPMPKGPKGIGGCELNATIYGINGTIKDKKKRDAAWEYIKFMQSDEAKKIYVSRLVEAGYAKFIHPNYLKQFGYEEYISDVPKEWIKMYDEMLATAHPEPYGKNCQNIYNFMNPPIDKVVLYDDVDYQKELDLAVQKTNEKLLNYVPEETMNKRRKIVTLVLIVLMGIFAFFFVIYIKGMLTSLKNQSAVVATTPKPGDRSKIIFGWILMAPALLTILIWHYYPLIRGLFMAFQDYKIVGISKWIGIDNFVSVLYEDTFWIALKNTFLYTLISLTLGYVSPIILALLLNEIPKGSLVFRVFYYLPHVTSPLVVLLLWKRFYDPTPEGLFNQALKIVGIEKQLWLQDPNLAMICIIVVGVWSGLGAGSIFYLAALKVIPEELYEAADLDGANTWQKIIHITLPVLKPLLIITLVGAFIGSFHATQNILAMTGGGPLKATHVLGLEIFYNAFVYLKFGYATAVAWIMGGILIGFTVQQLKILRESKFKAGGE